MNIYFRELKSLIKPLCFWTIGLFVLLLSSMTKYVGFTDADSADLIALLDSFPRAFLAVFGMADANVTTLSGYFSIVAYYSLIMASVYGANLGHSAVCREFTDKTYEFIFTKPCSRSSVLISKALAALTVLLIFCLLFALGSIVSLPLIDADFGDLTTEIFLYTVLALVCGLMFFTLALAVGAVTHSHEKASLISNLAVLAAFIFSALYELTQSYIFRLISPFKYFIEKEIASDTIDFLPFIVPVLFIPLTLYITFKAFNMRDFKG